MNVSRPFIPFALSAVFLAGPVQAASFPADFEPRRMTPDQGWFLTSSTSSSALAGSYRGIGDINGDGYDDYMVGSGNWAEMPAHYLIYGDASGQMLTLAPDTAEQAGVVHLGDSLHAFGIGDFDGDGLDDWILQPVGDLYNFEPLNSPEGDGYLVLGQTARFTSPFDIQQAKVIRLLGTAPSDYQGESRIHPVGDFNGDDLTDLMILESVSYDAESADAWLLFGRSGIYQLRSITLACHPRSRAPFAFPGPSMPTMAHIASIGKSGQMSGSRQAAMSTAMVRMI